MLALFQEPTISLSHATVIGLIAIAGSIGASWIASTRSAGKFEGKVQATFESIFQQVSLRTQSVDKQFETVDSDIIELKDVDNRQWREIGTIRERLATQEARCSANHSKGHHA